VEVQMNRIIALALFLTLCVLLSACKSVGQTKNAEIDYGHSVKFTETEVKAAIDTVLIKFRDFNGCDLKNIWYDEDKSNSEIESYMSTGSGSANGSKPKNVIILFSDFYVDSFGGDGSFNSNFTYTDWIWTLIREHENDSWKVDDWGY
jgi:hypothetical protein